MCNTLELLGLLSLSSAWETEKIAGLWFARWGSAPRLTIWINSILTTTNQEQLTYIILVVSAEIPERKGSVYPSNFYRQLPNY